MRDGHDDDDGVFRIPPATVTVIADVCKIDSYALRVTAVTVMTAILGYPRHCHPYGRTPRKRNMQAWALLALFGS